LAVFFATLVDHSGELAPGETGYVVVLAASKDQAKAIKNYAEGFLRASPMLASSIADVTADEIRLHGGIVIGIHAANYRTIRGRTLLACIFDEVSFWRSEESAQPDLEVYRAVVPALSTTGGNPAAAFLLTRGSGSWPSISLTMKVRECSKRGGEKVLRPGGHLGRTQRAKGEAIAHSLIDLRAVAAFPLSTEPETA
jgi:hypothetical protein